MAKPEPTWWAEARKLRAKGFSKAAIARATGVTSSNVTYALDEHGERRAVIERKRIAQRRQRSQLRSSAEPLCLGEAGSVVHWTPRPIRPIIDRAALRAILANREGGIDRAELMRRITPGGANG